MKIDKKFIIKALKAFKDIGEKEIPVVDRSMISKIPSVEEYMRIIGIQEPLDNGSVTLLETIDDDTDDRFLSNDDTSKSESKTHVIKDEFDLPEELNNLSPKDRYIENLLRPLGISTEEEHFQSFDYPEYSQEEEVDQGPEEDVSEMISLLKGIPKSDVKRPDWLNKELFDDNFKKERPKTSFNLDELLNDFKSTTGLKDEEIEEKAKSLPTPKFTPEVKIPSKAPEVKPEPEPEPLETSFIDEDDLKAAEEDSFMSDFGDEDEDLFDKEFEQQVAFDNKEDFLPKDEIDQMDKDFIIQPNDKDESIELGDDFWKEMDERIGVEDVIPEEKGFDDILAPEEEEEKSDLDDFDSFLEKTAKDSDNLGFDNEDDSIPTLGFDDESEKDELFSSLEDEEEEDKLPSFEDEDEGKDELSFGLDEDDKDLDSLPSFSDELEDLDALPEESLSPSKVEKSSKIDEAEFDELGDLAALDEDIDFEDSDLGEKEVISKAPTKPIEKEISEEEDFDFEKEHEEFPDLELYDSEEQGLEDTDFEEEPKLEEKPIPVAKAQVPVEEDILFTPEELQQILAYIQKLPPALGEVCQDVITNEKLKKDVMKDFINLLKSKASAEKIRKFIEPKLGIKIYIPEEKKKKEPKESRPRKGVGVAMLLVAGFILVIGIITLLYFLFFKDYKHVQSLYEKGYAMIEKDDFVQSEDYYKQAVKAESKNIPDIDWMYKYGIGYMEKANESKDESSKVILTDLALKKFHGADPDSIEPDASDRGMVDLDELNEKARLKIAEINRNQAEFQQAIKIGIEPLVNSYPHEKKYLKSAGYTYELWGDYQSNDEMEDSLEKYDKSYEYYNKNYKSDKGDYESLASLINVHLKKYEVLNKIHPNDALKLKQSILQQGVVIVDKLNRNEYIDPGVTTKLANFYIKNNEEKIGQGILHKLSQQGQELISKSDENEGLDKRIYADSFFSLGKHYRNLNKYDDALIYYVEGIKTFGKITKDEDKQISEVLGDLDYDRDNPKDFYQKLQTVRQKVKDNLKKTFDNMIIKKDERNKDPYAVLLSDIFNEIGEIYLINANKYFPIAYESGLEDRWPANNQQYYDRTQGNKGKGIRSEDVERKEYLELANKNFLMSIIKNPNNYKAYKNLGDINKIRGLENGDLPSFAVATTYYEAAFQKFSSPKLPISVPIAQKDLDKLLLSINSVLTKKDESFLYNFGSLYYKNGEYEKASNIWRLVHANNLNSNRFNPMLNISLGNSYFKLGQQTMAIDLYRRILDYYSNSLAKFEQIPDYESNSQRNILELVANASNNLAITFYQLGYIEQAKKYFLTSKVYFEKVKNRYEYLIKTRNEKLFKEPTSFNANEKIFINNYEYIFTQLSTKDLTNQKRQLQKQLMLIEDIPSQINEL